jgi:lipocalin
MMMARLSSSFLAVLLLALALPTPTSAFFLFDLFGWLFGKGNDCADISSVDNFDLSAFIAKSWYVQRQQVNTYQPPDRLFCVVATYEEVPGQTQWFQPAISVRNYAAGPGVNVAGSLTQLCATRTDRPGQLRVAPCFLPSFFGGPYWVVATDNTSYAIVTGGKLVTPGSCDDGDNLCTTRDDPTIKDPLSFVGNNQGLWFFTRVPNPPAAVLELLEEKAAELGICTADMLPVVQAGCDYSGAQIK